MWMCIVQYTGDFFFSRLKIAFFSRLFFLCSRDETPTVEQTQAFVDVCETFIRRNPLHVIGRLSLWIDFLLTLAFTMAKTFL